MSEGKIYGIALGPGDPELISLKGYRALQQADKIYFPGSLTKDGVQDSYSYKILQHYDLDLGKAEGMYFKMSRDRTLNQQIYQDSFERIRQDYEQGLDIALVSEGDISFYSTFSYFLEKMHHHNWHVELIPGIPSFIHAAAEGQYPIALQDEKIAVIPRPENIQTLTRYLAEFDTVVLMKISSCVNLLLNEFDHQNHYTLYCERLGNANQFITSDLEQLKDRKIPYFSLLIIKHALFYEN